MANLGTLDMASRYALGNDGLDTFDKYLARNIASNGTDAEKMGYLLGSYLGNYFGKQRRKKDDEKINNTIDNMKQDVPAVVSDDNGIYTTNKGWEKLTTPNTQISGDVIGISGNPNATAEMQKEADLYKQQTDNAINAIAQKTNDLYANAGFNKDYAWDNVKRRLEGQGVSSKRIAAREGEIKNDIAQQARAFYEPQIRANLQGQYVTDKDGKQVFQRATPETMLKAFGQIEELRKYDPTTADKFSALTDSSIANAYASADKQAQAEQAARLGMARDNNKLLNQLNNAITRAQYNVNNGYNPNGTRLNNANNLKMGDRINLGKYVSGLEATLRDRYPDGKMNMDDTDVQEWRNGKINLGYPDPLAQQGNPPNNPQQGNKGQGVKEAFKDRLSQIDVGNWESINKGGLELVDMLRKKGMSYDDAMEEVLKALQPRISPEEYEVFKGDFRTKNERLQDTLNPKPYQPFKDWTLSNDAMGRELKRKYEEEQKKKQQQ